MIATAQLVALEVLGTLAWDLPATKEYSPNTPLPVTLKVANPTNAARKYKLQAQLLVGNQVVWYQDLLVDNQQWFEVGDGKTLSITVPFQTDRTDCIFKVVLIDQATNTTLTEVKTNLVAPAPPGLLDQILPLLSLVMVMGIMSPMMSMFKKR